MFRTFRVILAVAAGLALMASAGSTAGSAARSTRTVESVGGSDSDIVDAAPEPECRMQTNGRNVCGYNCQMGSNGRVACADTPDGVCGMNTDGSVSCSQLRHSRFASGGNTREKPECRMGTDGIRTCGYNCRMGTNGRFYCASHPDYQCAFNSDGTFTCP